MIKFALNISTDTPPVLAVQHKLHLLPGTLYIARHLLGYASHLLEAQISPCLAHIVSNKALHWLFKTFLTIIKTFTILCTSSTFQFQTLVVISPYMKVTLKNMIKMNCKSHTNTMQEEVAEVLTLQCYKGFSFWPSSSPSASSPQGEKLPFWTTTWLLSFQA